MSTENVELVFRIRAEGQATLQALRTVVAGLTGDVDKGAKATAAFTSVNNELVITLKAVTTASGGAAEGHKKTTESMSSAIVKGTIYSTVLMSVVSSLKEATVEATVYAARTQQLGVVMDQLAKVNNLNVQSVRAQAEAVKGLGITTQDSRETINKMIFAQLDLTKATDLARLSQNAAKIAGISSSEALSGIIAGIVEQRIQMLRTYGIQVSFEQALVRGAKALNKTKETLDDYERSNIALNEVLSKAPRILGVYEVSLTTTAGQMQSFQRYADEAKNALGDGLTPVLQRAVKLMTDLAKAVKENSDGFAEMAKGITAAGIALVVARLTPGGPVAKLLAGGATYAAVSAATNINPVTAATDNSVEAIQRVQEGREDLKRRFRADPTFAEEDYQSQDKQLAEAQLQIQRNLAGELAAIYKKRIATAKAGTPDFGGTVGSDIPFNPYTNQKQLDQYADIPESINLGSGRAVTKSAIVEALAHVGEAGYTDKDGLKITRDPGQALEAILGSYAQRTKEAMKTATASTQRAQSSLLYGDDKIEVERTTALAKLAEEFKPFNDAFKKAMDHIGDIKDPKDQEKLRDTVGISRGQYGAIVAKTNQEFDLKQQKATRDANIDELKRQRDVQSTKDKISVDSTRDAISRQVRTAKGLRDVTGNDTDGTREDDIQKQYEAHLALAKLDRQEAQKKAQDELDFAEKIYQLKASDEKSLKDAKTKYAIEELQAEAKLAKDSSAAEEERQRAILDLRKKQREEVKRIYENAQKVADAERDTALAGDRSKRAGYIKLAAARASGGDERYVQELEYAERIRGAKEEFSISMETIAAKRKQSYDAYLETHNAVDLEKTSAELRAEEIKAIGQQERSILEARIDREVEIANIRKQQTEELRASLNSLYDALKANGKGGFRDFLQGYADQIKKTLFTNIGVEIFKGLSTAGGGIIKGQEKIDPVTGKGTGELTTLGRILKGTPLGVDPAKLAQDREINSRDRNTKSIDKLSDILTGTATTSIGTASGGTSTGSGGGILSKIGGAFGQIFGVGTGMGGLGAGGGIIRNFTGGNSFVSSGSTLDMTPDIGFGGTMARISGAFKPKINPQTGKPGFSAGATALAAAAAIPSIIGSIQEGGAKGALGAISSALGVAASIPGPQQPFLIAGALFTGLIGGLLVDPRKKKLEALNNTLSQKFELPSAIDSLTDLAGNQVDYDSRGNLRSYNNKGGTTANVYIQTMDAQSFMDNGPMIAESVRNMVQLGHPLRSTIGQVAGVE